MLLCNCLNIVDRSKATADEVAKDKACKEAGDTTVEATETEGNKEATDTDLHSVNSINTEDNVDIWTQEELVKESRKFNIDLAPKVPVYDTLKSKLLIYFFYSYILQEVILWNFSYLPIYQGTLNSAALVEC